jgi:hypothetical protein
VLGNSTGFTRYGFGCTSVSMLKSLVDLKLPTVVPSTTPVRVRSPAVVTEASRSAAPQATTASAVARS